MVETSATPLIKKGNKGSNKFGSKVKKFFCCCIKPQVENELIDQEDPGTTISILQGSATQSQGLQFKAEINAVLRNKAPKGKKNSSDKCLVRSYPIDRTQLYGKDEERVFGKFTITNIKVPKSPQQRRPSSISEKQWKQGHVIFHKYDESIRIQKESMKEITHENIAKYIANRCSNCQVIIDGFSGYGGNTIQFALKSKVIAIEIDPQKILAAKQIAMKYGVQDNITWIQGDYFQEIKKLQGDLVFLNPSFSESDMLQQKIDLETQITLHSSTKRNNNAVPTVQDILESASHISKNIWLLLPKYIDPQQCFKIVSQMPVLQPLVELEQYFYKDKLKKISVILGNMANISLKECTNILASRLNESGQPQKAIIANLLEKIGHKICIQMLTKTEKIQLEGGIQVNCGEARRRTKGGVFFHIMRNETDIDWKKDIDPINKKKDKKTKSSSIKMQLEESPPHNIIPDSPLVTENMHSKMQQYDLQVTRSELIKVEDESPTHYEETNAF